MISQNFKGTAVKSIIPIHMNKKLLNEFFQFFMFSISQIISLEKNKILGFSETQEATQSSHTPPRKNSTT